MNPSGSRGTLTDRQASILGAVCREYVVHGGEVASKSLVRAHGFRCSPATLRSELAVLERLGFVRRPHRSAGCSPTPSGLSHYVAQLQQHAERGPDPGVARAVDRSLRDLRGAPEQRMRAAVCVLSEVSGCLAVTFVGGDQADRVRTVDLVPLVGDRLLAVVEMDGGARHLHTVDLEAAATAESTSLDPSPLDPVLVERMQVELRRLCTGRTLPQAREAVLRRMGERQARVDRILAHALTVALVLSSVGPLDPLWMQVAGGPMLARGGVDADRLGDVWALLEDDQRLAEVLSQLVGPTDGVASPRAHVHVGSQTWLDGSGSEATTANGDDDGPTLTLVGCHVPLAGPNGSTAKRGAVALIGPDRMDYAAVIPLVEYAARALAATIEP